MNYKNVLLITPEYETINKHIEEYVKYNINVEVVIVSDSESRSQNKINGLYVNNINYKELRSFLMTKSYDAVLVYKINSKIEKYLLTSYLTDTIIIELKNQDSKKIKSNEKIKDFYQLKMCKNDEIDKEIAFIEKNIKKPEECIKKVTKIAETPLLTVCVPAYNAEKTLHKCIKSLLKTDYAYLTEILVINDGSKDKTSEIGKLYEDLTTLNGNSIVKIINKENGGHGSGINKAIELGKGKYFKVIDADDWVNEVDYNKLLEILINEDSDLILTDFCEARIYEDKPTPINYYENLKEGIEYNFDDLCTSEKGFGQWGPMLPTATYKLEKLRKSNFKLFEKTFYVDMIYNAYSIIYIETVKKYNLDIYRYYIGNEGQSVSEQGMKKNHQNHEDVAIELMRIVAEDKRFSDAKRDYVLNKLCLPMVYVQYYIYLELFRSRKKFLGFEKRAKQYKELMKYPEFNKRIIKFHRYTKGMFIKITPFIKRQLGRMRSILVKLKRM